MPSPARLAMARGPAAVLDLQRKIGNRAVTRFLARQPAHDVDDEPAGIFDAVGQMWDATVELGEARGRKDWAKCARILAPLGQDFVLPLLKDFSDKELAAIDAAAKPLTAGQRDVLHRQISFLRRRIPDVEAQRGVAVHDAGRQDVSVTVDGGAVEARVKVAYRDLEDLTGEDVISGFSLSYTGRDAARAHWIQFVWREIIFERSGEKPKPLGGTYKTDSGTWPLTTDETKPQWHVDSVSKTVPFYEATGDHNTSAGNLTVFDDPGAAQDTIKPHMKGRNQPTRVISRVHFASYLVRDMDVLHRIDTNIEWIFTGTKLTSKTGAAESKGSPGGLDKLHIAALLQQYSKFDYFAEAAAKAPPAAPVPAKTK